MVSGTSLNTSRCLRWVRKDSFRGGYNGARTIKAAMDVGVCVRYENMDYTINFKGKEITENRGVVLSNTPEFTHNKGGNWCPALRAANSDTGVLLRCKRKNMKKSELNREVRKVYRACRRKYGIEKTQDECLRVFKVVFPDLCRVRNHECEETEIPDTIAPGIKSVTDSWNAGGKLKNLIEKVVPMASGVWKRNELIDFYEDITPVAMRIRKLTPRECFRLMGVDDRDIDKIQASGVSNSGQYKLAGNSIVVDVLYHLFRKLLVETGPDIKKGEAVQLSLF